LFLLTGTTSETHIKADLAIFDFELTANEYDAIKTLLSAPVNP
jgi:diketogulonate reductase-like aldo/keto reductase